MIKKYITHSKRAIDIAREHGWHHGARYTNLRDIRHIEDARLGFLDIDWKNYSFDTHLRAAEITKPQVTIARDVESINDLENILEEASQLIQHADRVAIVPKDTKMEGQLTRLIPPEFMLAYSVPSKYGGTKLTPSSFDRPVHLLGGRPDVQRALANKMPVISFDCNRFTYDAKFGDYFDGKTFRPHPKGGYENCLRDSLKRITELWHDYTPSRGITNECRSK